VSKSRFLVEHTVTELMRNLCALLRDNYVNDVHYRASSLTRARVEMTKKEFWLNVPQAVVLEATRNTELVCDLTDDDPNLLVIRANQLIAPCIVIPLEADADEDRRLEAVRKFREAKTGWQRDNPYLQAQQRVHDRLVAGVITKARMTVNGPWEIVDPLELTRVELAGVHAVDKTTRTVSLYDLRIHGFEYIENLTGRQIGAASASSDGPPEIIKELSQAPEKWDCPGDPIPTLTEWARSKWGDDLQKLPNRSKLLEIFRKQYGRVLGVNEKTMRDLRNELATEESRRGGAPTHCRRPGK
jgi:hypothetical protein